ncbi:MAG: thioesterase [Gammaproteobacteria bacterium]|nr:thioesterase [Gammaproteobacteria bacterium]
MASPTPGLSATIDQVISKTMLANHVGSGSAPVFATPELALLIEKAAVAAIENNLEEGMTSVGTRLDISHLAATPVGMEVSATAKLTAVEGRKLTFEVSASDAVEDISKGVHIRYLVDEKQFVDRAQRKLTD